MSGKLSVRITVQLRLRYGRNFECFYRNYGYGTVTVRYSQFPTHTKTALYLTYWSIVTFLETLTWSKPQTHGQPPAARDGHTACVIGSRMYIFGGPKSEHFGVQKRRHLRWSRVNARPN